MRYLLGGVVELVAGLLALYALCCQTQQKRRLKKGPCSWHSKRARQEVTRSQLMLLTAVLGHAVRTAWAFAMPLSNDQLPFLPKLAMNRLSTLLLFLSFSMYINQCLLVSSSYVMSERSLPRHIINAVTWVVACTSGAIMVYYVTMWLLCTDDAVARELPFTKYDLYYVVFVWVFVAIMFLLAGRAIKGQLIMASSIGGTKNERDFSPLIRQLKVSSAIGAVCAVGRGIAYLLWSFRDNPDVWNLPEGWDLWVFFFLPDVVPTVTISLLVLGKAPLTKNKRARDVDAHLIHCVSTGDDIVQYLVEIETSLSECTDHLPPTPSPSGGEICSRLMKTVHRLVQEPHNWDVVQSILEILTRLAESNTLVGTERSGVTTKEVTYAQYLLDAGVSDCLQQVLDAVAAEGLYLNGLDPMRGMGLDTDGTESQSTSEEREGEGGPVSLSSAETNTLQDGVSDVSGVRDALTSGDGNMTREGEGEGGWEGEEVKTDAENQEPEKVSSTASEGDRVEDGEWDRDTSPTYEDLLSSKFQALKVVSSQVARYRVLAIERGAAVAPDHSQQTSTKTGVDTKSKALSTVCGDHSLVQQREALAAISEAALQLGICVMRRTPSSSHQRLFDDGILSALLSVAETCLEVVPSVARFTRLLLVSDSSIDQGTLRPDFLPLLERIVPKPQSAEYWTAWSTNVYRAMTLQCLKSALSRDSVTKEGCLSLLTGPHNLHGLLYPIVKTPTTEASSSYGSGALQMQAEATYVLRILASKIEPSQTLGLLQPLIPPLATALQVGVVDGVSSRLRVLLIDTILDTCAQIVAADGLDQPSQYHKSIHDAVVKVLTCSKLNRSSLRMCATLLFNMSVVGESIYPSLICDTRTVKALVAKIKSSKTSYRELVPIWRLFALWSGNESNRAQMASVNIQLHINKQMGVGARQRYVSKHGPTGDETMLDVGSIYSVSLSPQGHQIGSVTGTGRVAGWSELCHIGTRLEQYFKWVVLRTGEGNLSDSDEE
ncbi:hypothetical protein KIPB_000302 [Kipferlia bialata]|uniref:Uncharacterized protein n=1 Tax=Kipferlia bialata TaxID=797122 RepID=A0A9K3GEE0_9EUKA|nr:hypothetical protein KIPB_000302 [Kipferlia bialata]|eukprot:g302.t1